MHPLVYLNDRLVDAGKARIGAVSAAMLYGRGVFTLLAIYQGRPLLWSRHWTRLVEHAGRAGVDCHDFDEAGVGAALAKLIEANHIHDGRARVTLLAGADKGAWRAKGAGQQKTDLLILTGEPRAASPDGLALTVSPYRISTFSPLAGVKSINYLDHILSWEEARGRDFHDAVALNERGEVVSATMANIFWVIDGTIHTPALATGAVAGTTRDRIITLASELAIPLVEGVYELSQLADADEIFLTSAGLGVAIVTTFDFRRYTVPSGSTALRLREAFRQLTLQAN